MNDERSRSSLDEIIGDTPQLKQMLQLAMKVAGTDAPVLVLGEAGSGKRVDCSGSAPDKRQETRGFRHG